MTDYQRYINALRKCANEHENDRTFTGHIVVSALCRDTANLLETLKPRKGEWLRMSDLSEQEDDRYKCSRCGNVIHYNDKMNLYTFNSWCGRCGSDNGRHINFEVEE